MAFRRWAWISLLVAAVVLGIAYGFVPRAIPVDTARASRGALVVTVEEEGKTRVRERYTITAPVEGYLQRIGLDAGDRVRKGQTVAIIEPPRSSVHDPRTRAETEAALAVAKAAMRGAEERERAVRARRDYAAKKLERTKKLFRREVVAEDTLDLVRSEAERAEAELSAAEAAVLAAKFDLEKARAALGFAASGEATRLLRLRSPVDGRVLKVLRESEGAVLPKEPLLEIGDPARLEVVAEVLSADAVRIREGAVVLLERWGGKTPIKGRVRTIEPAGFTKVSSLGVEEQRVNVIADFTDLPEEARRMGDGYRVDASFVVWEGKDVLKVPVSSLFRYKTGWAVFVVKNGRARKRPLEVGHMNGLFAEVASGLKEGEIVITHPDDAIDDGVRVRAKSAGG